MKRYIFLVFFALFSFSNVLAQEPGLFGDTLYLKYIHLAGEDFPKYVPLNENFNLIFTDDNGVFSAEANGVENGYSATATFLGNTLSFTDQGITLLGCSSENCFYEDLYFYEVLTDQVLNEKTFIYNYNEYNQGQKSFLIRDSNFNTAYYTNTPVEVPQELFQTWYLYELGADLEPPSNIYGPDVPRITINPDLTFTGVNDDVTFEGNFVYGENFVNAFEFILQVENLTGGYSGIPELVEDYDIYSVVGEDYFSIEPFPGFYSAFRNTITLSTDEFLKKKIHLFPNPVAQILQIKSQIPISKLTIYSILGVVIAVSEDSNTQDVSSLAKGVYFLKIETEEGDVLKRFVKQ